MRNLKKILALVLALVMSLSLMATAGAGSFQDVTNDNPYKTAIDVLDELKVFQGFEDGSFKPTDTLNRAQAAVLVYRIATGDVEGKYVDNYTYMAQSKFTDLDGYTWAKGYINYCQNAKIVVGTSATTFNPGDKVTGYQLMVMLLRTLGYGAAGEFADPKGWELQTASIAEREGITKNVTTGDFGAPAPRQMVAEILFRGLLSETVQYSALTPGGYTKTGETLGKRELGLEDVKGVVMANEFADLEDDDTLADGKTRLDVDGKTYNLDVKSELTDIGEIRHAYVQNGTKVLTTLENQGDSVVNQPENGAATKVKDLSKTNSDTQYFLNFEETAKYSSAYKIKYVTVYDSEAEATAAQKRINDASGAKTGSTEWAGISVDDNGDATVVTRTIPAKDTITSVDLSMMKEIFGVKDKWADEDALLESGAVYVGTQSIVDISDVESENFKYSYDKFEEEFITDKNIAIEDSDNGEWLKTIDNDGDGVADYVFRTDFVMSVIDDYNTKNETYYVEYDADSNGTDRKTNDTIKKSDIVTEDELNVGDVILYTWIDGKCYVSKPEVDTAAIDKKGINYKAETITCGDTTYEWSGIEQEAYHYYHDVSEAQTEVNYNLYKDHFGYVRLFAEANKGFVLLTDGFYATDRKHADNESYKAEIWDDEAAKLAEVDVVAPARDTYHTFIDDTIDSDASNREEGTWARLRGFDEVYWDHVDNTAVTLPNDTTTSLDYITNIAVYDVNSDGAYDLDVVNSYTGRYWYSQHELDITSFEKGKVTDKDLKTTGNHSGDGGRSAALDRINATDETKYYYVEYSTDRYGVDRVEKVSTWIGYNEGKVGLVTSSKGGVTPDRAYAVTCAWRNDADTAWLNYETAEIIVIEHEITGAKELVLPVALTQKLIGKNNEIGGTGFVWNEDGEWNTGDFEGYAYAQNASVKSLYPDNNLSLTPVDISDLLRFYEKQPDGTLLRIDGDYNDYNIYAGEIVTKNGTASRSYSEISLKKGAAPVDKANPDHTFYASSDNFYTIGYNRSAATDKDNMLLNSGWQNTTVYGDVAKTFSADELGYSKMDIGDKVIYVTDGDGVVQSIINVTDSKMDKNYDATAPGEAGAYPGVYKDDVHHTGYKYKNTATLLTLWNVIATSQKAADPATNTEPTVAFYGKMNVKDNATAKEDISLAYGEAAENKKTAEDNGEVFNKLTVTAPTGCTIVLAQLDGMALELNSDKDEAVVALPVDGIPEAGETEKVLIVTVSNGEKEISYTYGLTLDELVDNAAELELVAADTATWLLVTDSDVENETATVNVQGSRTINQVIAGLKVVYGALATTGTPGEDAGTVRYDGENGSDIVNTGDVINAVVVNEDGNEYPVAITVTTLSTYTVSNADGTVLATALEGDTVALDKTTLGDKALKGFFTLKDADGKFFDGTSNWTTLAANSYMPSDDDVATGTDVTFFTMPASNVTLEDDYWKLSTGYQESQTDVAFFKAGEDVTIEDDASQSALGVGWVTLTDDDGNVIGSDAVLDASATTATFTALAAPATGDEYTVDVAQAKVILHNMQDADTANDVTKYVDVADAATGLTLVTGDVSNWYTTDANSGNLGDAFANNGTATIANLNDTGDCVTNINYGYYKITIEDSGSTTVKKTDIGIDAADTVSELVSNDIYTTGAYTIKNNHTTVAVNVNGTELAAGATMELTATADGTITLTTV